MSIRFEEYDTVNICTAFVTAFEYGDYTGVSDEEEHQIDEYLSNLPSPHYFEYGSESFCGRCKVTGLMADCVEVKIRVEIKE